MSQPEYEKKSVGKPLKFKTIQELQEAIDEYFNYCDNRLVQGYDNKTNEQFAYISPAPYTMSGLARRIGLSRQGLLDYSKRDKYLDTIKEARNKVQEDVETRLMEKQPAGAIFNLKNNFNWKDKTEVEGSFNIGVSIGSNQAEQLIRARANRGDIKRISD